MRILATTGLVVLATALAGCQTKSIASASLDADTLGSPDGDRAAVAPRRSPNRRTGPPPAAGEHDVAITNRELAALDGWISAGREGRNSRWILGDVVEVTASREYFSQVLTVNRGNFVRRTDRKVGRDTVVLLEYLGHPGQRSALTSPRVQIGTGLTVTARERLVLRLAATSSRAVPIRLHIVARGEAVRGHREEVGARAPSLRLGGEMRRRGGAWRWVPYGED